MKTKTIISKFAILTVMFAYASYDACAGVRIGNKSRTYADAYNQVNDMTAQRVGMVTTAAPATNYQNAAAADASSDVSASLPIRVANAGLAQKIANGDASAGVTINDLERCGMIYPGGEFAWDNPTAGVGRGTGAKCVAVVEMRALNAAPDGSDLVLARANVASGDNVLCNISEFPEADYNLSAIENFEFPADKAPTMDDVKKVLDAEQKQNAGFKIAATAVIGAVGGNMIGKNDVGKDGLLGTDKGKVQGSVIGALAGAAIGAGNAYAGKVGGDVILSTGVNATAGGIMGNVLATGDSVLRIEECEVGGKHTTCLWGYVMAAGATDEKKEYFFNITDGETAYGCYMSDNDIPNTSDKCSKADLVNIRITKYPDKDVREASATNWNLITDDDKYYLCKTADGKTEITKQCGGQTDNSNVYVKIISAGTKGKQYPAMVPDVADTTFGLKASDWNKWRREHPNATPVGRGAKGTAVETKGSESYKIENFYPIYRSAEDGGIIDFGNKARLKATVTGAGVGGALGAFSGYQGAQNDISERWATAMREYEDSLGKVYCITGKRPLGQYNSVVEILSMP